MPELNTVTDPYLPEPKGASTATNGQIYIANGAGSGAWIEYPGGWANYLDNTAQVITTADTKLSIDGAAGILDAYLPRAIRGSGNLWNTTTDNMTPIALGDCYNVRITLPITAETGAITELKIDLDIGGGGTPTNVIETRFFKTGRSVPYTVTFATSVFCLTTFLANGMQIFLAADAGTCTITNPSIFIQRTFSGLI